MRMIAVNDVLCFRAETLSVSRTFAHRFKAM
jgi:hypothetical protein